MYANDSEKVIEETINSPLLQTKWQKLIEAAGDPSKEGEKKKDEEKPKKEEKSGEGE